MLGDSQRTTRGSSGRWRAGTARAAAGGGSTSSRRRRGRSQVSHQCVFGGTAWERRRRQGEPQEQMRGESMARLLCLLPLRKPRAVPSVHSALPALSWPLLEKELRQGVGHCAEHSRGAEPQKPSKTTSTDGRGGSSFHSESKQRCWPPWVPPGSWGAPAWVRSICIDHITPGHA